MSQASLRSAKVSVLIFFVSITGLAATRKAADLNEKYSKRHCELMSIYLTGAENAAAPIVIVLHGDAPFVNSGYQYSFASNLADAVPGTRVVTIFRTSSPDPYEASLGIKRAIAFGETYTLKAVDDVAGAIQSLKSRWKAPAVVLVGDGGGAAVAAYVAAFYPGLIQRVVLISCPYDVPALTLRSAHAHSKMSLFAAHSLSPMQALDQMSKETNVTVIAGMNDSITPAESARSYVASTRARGLSAAMILIPTSGHEILNKPVVIEGIAKAITDN